MATEIRKIDQADGTDEPLVVSNGAALVGFILAAVAAAMCGLLFFLVGQLPADINKFQEELGSDTPGQLRLLILGCSTVLLVSVSFVLCVVALFLPNRPRILAGIGAGLSLLILLGVFTVLVVGALMTPDHAESSSSVDTPSGAATVEPLSAEEPQGTK